MKKNTVNVIPRINILDTDKIIGKEFLTCLRRRNLPSKFEYWGKKEASHWLSICKDPEYVNWRQEIDLIRKSLPQIARRIGPGIGNLVGLGIGNGEKDKLILTQLTKHHPMRYHAIDISLDMMKTGLKALGGIPVEKNAYIGDFRHLEKIAPLIRKQTGSGNLYSILGNTFGNLDQKPLLTLLGKSMDRNDYLLMAVQMLETKEILNMGEILTAYSTSVWRDLSFGAMRRTGLRKSDGIIEMEFAPDKTFPQFHVVEYFYTFKKDKTITYLGERLSFKKGERIPIYFSYKYDEKNLNAMLDDYGFKIVRSFFAPGRKYLLALVKLK
jgi:uncharacterized SAM-dependent methyltransferase